MLFSKCSSASVLFLLLAICGLPFFEEVSAKPSEEQDSSRDICGGIIFVNKTESTRSIVSKAYTNLTERKNCSWEIVAPEEYVIVLNFLYLNLSETCKQGPNAENITIESKLGNTAYHQHGVFCGKSSPSTIVSASSTLKITFSYESFASSFAAEYFLDKDECADDNGGCQQTCNNTIGAHECGCQRGFTLHTNKRDCKKDVCGGLIYGKSSSSGLITSPFFPSLYPNLQKCEWEIVSPPLHKIILNFTYFNLENSYNCRYDNVTVNSRLDIDEFQSHGSFCGSTKPEVIVSEGNVMRIQFSSDASISRQGFAAFYHVIGDECAEANGGCQHNCINSFSGHKCTCRTGFELTSDNHSCEEVCGGLILESNGTISSPLFPEPYPQSQSCQWNIVAPKGYRVKLVFYYFELENSKYCGSDNLTIYSRMGVEINKVFGVYCGSSLPPVIVSDTSNLIIQFESDSSSSNTGFTATYSFVDEDECATNNGGCAHSCCNNEGGYQCSCREGFSLHPDKHSCLDNSCIWTKNQASGNVSSINYPNQYPPNKHCMWRLMTKGGHRIQLNFSNFDLEGHEQCFYDYVAIYDEVVSNNALSGKYCGTSAMRTSIISSRNQMVVEFKSDALVERPGFTAEYGSVCGGNLIATTTPQDLYSHAEFGNQNYKDRTMCNWNITAPPGKTIKFRVNEFQLESSCSYDYLYITETVNGEYNHGKYCGSSTPPEITSRTNSLNVQFRTDASNVFRGFAAKYFINSV